MTAVRRLALPVLGAIGFSMLLLVVVGAPPVQALGVIVTGSVGSMAKLADTITAWVPLALAAAGLVVTFKAGLWNIGVEGQIIAGAIAATWVARTMPGPGWTVMGAALAAGVAGGALWAGLAGVLRVRWGINEIFGGLGLGFVAQAFATYLVIGPWKRAGIASTSGTDLFRPEVWLPTIGSTRLSPLAVLLALASLILIGWLLARTSLGLDLRAVGSNIESARLVGLRAEAVMMSAFGIGGGLAGLAGGVLAIGVQHKLVPAIGGGRGFLGILVVLLAGYSIRWVGPIAFFFAAISVGSSQLDLRLDLNSSLGGVIQGTLVLVALLVGGWQARREERAGSVRAPAVEWAPGGGGP
jgi:general nucleoside transport system permease protein